MHIARLAVRNRLASQLRTDLARPAQQRARGRMRPCPAQGGATEDSKDVVLFCTSGPDAGDWEVELQRAGLPALTWPAKFAPNGTTKLEAVTFAVVWKPPPDLLGKCPNLKAVHAIGAGVDSILPVVPPGIPADPVMAQRMATWVAWAVINAHRKMDAFARGQAAREWMHDKLPVPDNGDVRVTVLGRGVMGLASARQLHNLGYSVCTCSRVPLGPEDEDAQRGMRNVTIDKVAGELPATDVLVCLLPLTDATRNIINAPLLAHLKRGAVFVNAARGEHVVEEDLLAALDSGAISGAILDVTRQEPLPEDSPLWGHPGVRLTAHTSSTTNRPTAVALIAENYRRLLRGEPMTPVVNDDTGY